ncbi:MAG TPA: DUF2950 domain-containing protein [Bosea sp. (in: a-proteobacteria)]|nr:DUF2950 domain-containing protein [Bosea sp. (in: a-proteobacteria)]
MIITRPTMRLLLRLLWRSAAGLLAAGAAAGAQEAFKSPDAAATALAAAARSGDLGQLYRVLGKAGREVLSSGDKVRDAAEREHFVAAYDVRHSIVVNGNKATILIGAVEFPFPIPILRSRDHWSFNVELGRKEIIARRIGRNELDAVQTCLAILDAQYEYASQDHDGKGRGVYAQRIVSRPETKDGLYWPAAPAEQPSPLGRLAADAAAEGYEAGQAPQPFHGYYFKILTHQGASAPGGAIDYVVGDKMIGGFAVLAYPAEYARSGLTSFILNHAGTVYQKDLGPSTLRIASRLSSFDPDSSWQKVALGSSQ